MINVCGRYSRDCVVCDICTCVLVKVVGITCAGTMQQGGTATPGHGRQDGQKRVVHVRSNLLRERAKTQKGDDPLERPGTRGGNVATSEMRGNDVHIGGEGRSLSNTTHF